MQTIITIITVTGNGIVQDCDAFVGDAAYESKVVAEAEAFFRKRASELFKADWDELPEDEKRACVENGYFDINKPFIPTGEIQNIYINWPTRHVVEPDPAADQEDDDPPSDEEVGDGGPDLSRNCTMNDENEGKYI